MHATPSLPSTEPRPALLCIGLSYRTAPVSMRERLVMSETERVELLRRLGEAPGEAVLLSTCNRVELYLATPDVALARRRVREELGRLGAPRCWSTSMSTRERRR